MATNYSLLRPLSISGLLGPAATPEEEAARAAEEARIAEEARVAEQARITAEQAAKPDPLAPLPETVATPANDQQPLDPAEELDLTDEELPTVHGDSTAMPAFGSKPQPKTSAEAVAKAAELDVTPEEDLDVTPEPKGYKLDPRVLDEVTTPTSGLAGIARQNTADAKEMANAPKRTVELDKMTAAYHSQIEQAINSPEMWNATPEQMMAMAKQVSGDVYGNQVTDQVTLKSLQDIAAYRKGGGRKPSSFSENLRETSDKDPNAAPTFGQSLAKGGATTMQVLWAGAEGFQEAAGADPKVADQKRQMYTNIANVLPKGIERKDIKSVGDALQWWKQVAGEQLPMMAAPMAGSIAGGMIKGSLGAALGAFGPSWVIEVGSIEQQNKEDDPNAKAGLATIVGGAAAATLDSVLPAKIGSQLVARVGEKAADEIAQRILLMPLKQQVAARLKQIGVEGLKGSLTEGGTEGLQNIVEELASSVETGKPVQPGVLSRAFEAAIMGAVIGGPVEAVTTAGTQQRAMDHPLGEMRDAEYANPASGVAIGALSPSQADGGVVDTPESAQRRQAQSEVVLPARPIVVTPEQRRARPVRVVPTPEPVDARGKAETFAIPKGRITSPFGHRESFGTDNGKRSSSNHKGIDIALPMGTPVGAGASGVVVRAGTAGGYGLQVVIKHSDGTFSSYSHASKLMVKKGQQVAQGDIVMKVGQSGNATGPHLHLERRLANGGAVNPLTGKTIRGGGLDTLAPNGQETVSDPAEYENDGELDTAAMDDTYTEATGQEFDPAADDTTDDNVDAPAGAVEEAGGEDAAAPPASPVAAPRAADIPEPLRDSPVPAPEATVESVRAGLDETSSTNPARAALEEAQSSVATPQSESTNTDWSQPQPGEQPMFARDAEGNATQEVVGFVGEDGLPRMIGQPSQAAAPAMGENGSPAGSSVPTPEPTSTDIPEVTTPAVPEALPEAAPMGDPEAVASLGGEASGVTLTAETSTPETTGSSDPTLANRADMAAREDAALAALSDTTGYTPPASGLVTTLGKFVDNGQKKRGISVESRLGKWMVERGLTRVDAGGFERLTVKGQRYAARAAEVSKRVEKISDKLDGMYNDDAPKSAVKAYALRLIKDGTLAPDEMNNLGPIFKDRDMDIGDVIDEIKASVSYWEDAQLHPDALEAHAAEAKGTKATKNRAAEKPAKKTLEEIIPGFAKVAKWLAPSERADVKAQAAKKMADLYDSLPSPTEMAAVAISAEGARGWYANAVDTILTVFGQTDGIRFAAVLAATSPQNSVRLNLYNTLKIWNGWNRAGRPQGRREIFKIMGESVAGDKGEASVLNAWVNNTFRALTEDATKLVLSGPKVNSFFANLTGDLEETTLDTWMAIYGGYKISDLTGKRVPDPMSADPKAKKGVKSPGYMAYMARVRKAAQVATKRTGRDWSPAEIQETVWSWAKTVYEMRDSAGENRSIKQMLQAGAVTKEMVANAENFTALFSENIFANILEEGGYGRAAGLLRGSGRTARQSVGVGSVTDSEGTGFTDADFKRQLERAADRIERRYRERGLERDAKRGRGGRVDERAEQSSDGGQRAAGKPVRNEGRVSGSAEPVAVNSGQDTLFDPALENAPGPIKVGDRTVHFGPLKSAREAAANYLRSIGREATETTTFAPLSTQRAKRIADAFEAMEHDPSNPEVKAAYEAMIVETIAQYREIEKTGLKIEFIDFAKTGDPYAQSPRLAQLDVAENNHLWVFKTSDGFGGSEDISMSDNPLLAPTDIEIGGHKLLANDVFRIVHDYFGHVKDGHGFRARGEENAWRSHSAMYSTLARRAMTTETRGQNSWVNYGPFGEANRTANGAKTEFAPQKIGLLPQWAVDEGALNNLYHGTPFEFEGMADTGKPVWFADSARLAEAYANARRLRKSSGDRIIPAKADFKKPLVVPTQDGMIEDPQAWAMDKYGIDLAANGWERTGPEYVHTITRSKAFGDGARALGHDAVAIEEGGSMTYGALDLDAVTNAITGKPIKQRRTPEQRRADNAAFKEDVQREAVAVLRSMGLEDMVGLDVVDYYAGIEFQGQFDPTEMRIKIAAWITGNTTATTRHEIVHFAREGGLISSREWDKLRAWAIRSPRLMAWARANYEVGSVDEYGNVFTEEDLIEEAVAEGFGQWAGGSLRDVMLSNNAVVRIFQKMADFFRAIRHAFSEVGLTDAHIADAAAILRDLENGKLAARKKGRDAKTTVTFGRKPSFGALSRQLLSGAISPEEHAFMKENPSVKLQAAYHGTPIEDIDEFSVKFIGTGEGAQVFGWGLYFAQKKDIAEWYRKKLTMGLDVPVDQAIMVGKMTMRDLFPDHQLAAYEVADRLMDFMSASKPYNGFLDGLHAKFDNEVDRWVAGIRNDMEHPEWDPAEHEGQPEIDKLEASRKEVGMVFDALKAMATNPAYEIALAADKRGKVYTVDVPEDHQLLDLDATLDNQSPQVKAALAKIKTHLEKVDLLDEYEENMNAPFEEWTGQELQLKILPRLAYDDAFPVEVSPELESALENGNAKVAASVWLRDLGIPGNRYLDRDSRTAEDEAGKTRNFVIFDDSAIKLKATKNRVVPGPSFHSPLSDPTVPNPSIIRRIQDQTMGFLSKIGSQGGEWDATDRMVDAFRRKLSQRYRQIEKTQARVADIRMLPRLPGGQNVMEMITADERGYKLQYLIDNMIRPMATTMAQRGIKMEDLGLYLYARHAQARNARIASINPEFKDTELTPGSGMSDSDAQRILGDFAADGRMADLQDAAQHIDAMVAYAQQERLNSGLLTPADIAGGFGPGDFYVPLRGNEALEPEIEMSWAMKGAGKGGGFSVPGNGGHPMYGRASRADLASIVGYTVTQAQDAVDRGYRNQVGQTMMAMFQSTPDNNFVQIDRVKRVPVWNEAKGQVEYQMQTRITDKDEQARTIYVKKDGVLHKMTFNNQNPSAMRFVAASKNLGATQIARWVQLVGFYTRFWSKSNTQWNLDFMMANAVKDIQSGVLNASTLNVKGLRRAMLKNITDGALKAALKGSFKKSGAGFTSNNPWDQVYAEFEANGGKINYNQSQSLDDAMKAVTKELKHASRGKFSLVRGAGTVIETIDNLNGGFENMTRLAAYKALRDHGIPAKQAAEAVRELTTNFQQHGEWGPTINMLYGFANASVIGGLRMGKTLATNPKVAVGLIVAGILSDLLNSWYDPDDWDKYSEEDKDKNLMFMTPDFVPWDLKIPAGYGLNSIITIGRKTSELWRGKMNDDGSKLSVLDAASDIGMSFINSFAPVSGATWANIVTPSAGDPFVDIWQNKNNWGRPIMPANAVKEKDQTPDSQLTYDSTDRFWKVLATTFNDWSGGNDIVKGAIDVSPESIKHVASETAGGSFRTLTRFYELAKRPFDDEPIQSNDIPILRRFVGTPYGTGNDAGEEVSQYYTRMNEASLVASEAKRLAERYGPEHPEYIEYYDAHKKLAEFAATTVATDKRMSKINAATNAAERGAWTRMNKEGVPGPTKAQRRAIAKGSGVIVPAGKIITPEKLAEIKAAVKDKKLKLAVEFNGLYDQYVMGVTSPKRPPLPH